MITGRRSGATAGARNSRNVLLVSQTPPPVVSQNARTALISSAAPTFRLSGSQPPARRLLRAMSADSQTDGSPRMYLLGTRIECRVPGWNRYYSGKVSAVNVDGTLMVSFDDGDLRDGIQLSNSYFEQRSSPSVSPSEATLSLGDQVEFCSEQKAIAGRISEITGMDRFVVTLCDGRQLRDVTREQLRIYKPNKDNLAPGEEIEVLQMETRTWLHGQVDETSRNVKILDETGKVETIFPISDLEIRYPITYIAPRQLEDEDCLDATPMILSMQERLSQSIEVGSHVLITDKNGGALPKTGKADSAQVSIINFPLPADGIIESVTLRLFEPPAEECDQLDVVLFDREQIPVTRTHRLSSTESSNDEGGNSPMLGAANGSGSVDIQVARFYVAPDLPYRPSRSQITVDPRSRAVQVLKLSVPLRGSAGQYLGLMNRKGRLNIAYTPDKKKPGESWSEKSVEVFYMMPRMVPKPFVGGPHLTRDWHGRAGWFAVMVVSDPDDAVDPGWQRRSALDALARRNGQLEMRRVCWLITTLVKEGRLDPTQILFKRPTLMRALRRLVEVDDSVVELITQLCTSALKYPSLQMQNPATLQPFIRLQKALRFKAWEMQAVQRGRLTSNIASFQSILRCSLVMKSLLSKVSPPQRIVPVNYLRTTRVALNPRSLDAPLPIMYHLKDNKSLFVSLSEIAELRRGIDELIFKESDDSFALLLKTTGPVPDAELYFPDPNSEDARQWKLWTSSVENVFSATKRGPVDPFEEARIYGENGDKKREKGTMDWLDELERATVLLQAFARQTMPPRAFIREMFILWRQRKYRIHVESLQSQPDSSDSSPLTYNVSIPGASRLKIEWHNECRLPDGDGSALMIEACGKQIFGRNGLPPPIERVEGSTLTISVVEARPFDPSLIIKRSQQAERADFPPAKGLVNANNDQVFAFVDRTGEARLGCLNCSKNYNTPGACCESLRAPENNEGRPVLISPTRGTWACGLCVAQPSPCLACSAFPYSMAFGVARARPPHTFSSIPRYVAFMRRCLVPNVPVRSVKEEASFDVQSRFFKFLGEVALTLEFSDPGSPPKQKTYRIEELLLVADPKYADGARANDGEGETMVPIRPYLGPGWESANANDTINGANGGGGTFAVNDQGPDIAISNNGQTVTRLRSVGWGTQRMSRYLDASCGVTTINFRIDRNTSNHLFFGVVAPSFDDWTRRLMEAGAWSIRRDGSTHADGRERSSATSDAKLVTGETLTMIVDMVSDPRSVSFMRGDTPLGVLQGLPPRVVPAVSFGGSNQVVTITSFQIGGNAAGSKPYDSGVKLDIIPEYDTVSDQEEKAYIAEMSKWTPKLDRVLVSHIDEVVQEKRMSLGEVLNSSWLQFVGSNNRRYNFLESLLQEGLSLDVIGQRFEWIRAFNASIADALPLLDLSFEDISESNVVRDLSECSHLLLEVLKNPMWEDALECTRTEEGQFEIVLDYGRALAHRQFVDIHGRFSIFGQAFRAMNSMPPSRLRGKGQLYRATLRGMRAHDDGGPYRQSFQTYCAELLSTPGVGLFLPCANRVNEIHVNRDRWLPNPGAKSAMQISMFEFVGKLMGIALRNHEYLDLRLPSLVWKWLVNRRPTMEDLRAVDLLFANTVQELLDSPKDDAEMTWGDDNAFGFGGGAGSMSVLNFTVYSLDGRLCELVPNGEQRLVSFAQDRQEWVRLATEFKLNEFNDQLEAIRRGLATVVPQRMLVLFTWEELELMVCGRPKIDLALLREKTVYVGCSEADPHIQAFWRVLTSFSEETRSLYLRFVWGRSRLPASKASWGETPHKISSFDLPTRQLSSTAVDSLLPRSHTCYFSLDLPRYSSEEVLRKKLLFAIENCTEIDADQTTTGNRSAALGFELDVDENEVDSQVGTPSTANLPIHDNNNNVAASPNVDPYLAALTQEHERRASQGSFGSDFDDYDEDICEAEVEVFARLGHDLEAVNVFEYEGAIDFGDDDDSMS